MSEIMTEPPLHVPDYRYLPVGPLVWFRQQAMPVPQAPPQNTCDPRYPLCVNHHLACDCREAEQNEKVFEFRSDLQAIRDAMKAVLDGHATEVYDGGNRRPDLECRCTGCQIARSVKFAGSLYDNRREISRSYPF